MNVNIPSRQNIFREMRDYLMIALGMIMYGIGWTVFLLPNDITTGGVPGIASLVYFATGLPVQYVYFGINFLLLLLAIRILGWKFSIKTIFAVFTLTFFLPVIQQLTDGVRLLHDQPFMACVIGASFCGGGIGIAFSSNGSTGGTDIIAAIINKYRDITLGRVMLICDLIIISSSYFVLKDWEKVVYGYVTLYICSFVLDQVVNSARPVRTILHHQRKVRRNSQAYQRISAQRGDSNQCVRILHRQRDKDAVCPCQEAGVDHYLPVDKRYRPERLCIAKPGNRSVRRGIRQD